MSDETVFVVDDDEAVQDSLRLLMKSIGLATETFASAAEFLESFDPEKAGCLILDIRMPGISGLDLQKELANRHSMLPIIFITGHGDVPMAVQAMKEGAVDFIQKPFRDQQLIDSVHRALKSDHKNRAQLLQIELIMKNLGTLTKREREIVDMIIDGKSNKLIADKLCVSSRTIEVHRARAMEKMEANSVAHLVRMVVQARSS